MILEYIKNYFKWEWVLFRSTLSQISPTLTGAPSILETPSLCPLLDTCPLTPSHPTLPYRATDSSSPDDWGGEGLGSLELRMTMKREIQVSNGHLSGQSIHSKVIKTTNKQMKNRYIFKDEWKWPWCWQIAGKRDRVTKYKIWELNKMISTMTSNTSILFLVDWLL